MDVRDRQLLIIGVVSVIFFMNFVTNIHRIEGWSIVTNGGGIPKFCYEYCYKYLWK